MVFFLSDIFNSVNSIGSKSKFFVQKILEIVPKVFIECHCLRLAGTRFNASRPVQWRPGYFWPGWPNT